MPAIIPLVAAVAGPLISKALGGSSGGLTTSPTFRREEQLGDLAKETAFDKLLPMGEKAYGDVLPYYEGVLGGNRAAISSALAPEISNLQSGYANAAKNIGTFTPQGGGMTSLLSELPFRETGDITNLISGARQNAASQLGNLAGQITGQGLAAGGLAESAFGQDINALLGAKGQQNPINMMLGGGIGQLLQNLPGIGGGSVSTGGLTTGFDPGLESAVSAVP